MKRQRHLASDVGIELGSSAQYFNQDSHLSANRVFSSEANSQATQWNRFAVLMVAADFRLRQHRPVGESV